MRLQKAKRNMFFSFVLEGVSLISTFILPRLIIATFGSETNGLINSIASFIGYIALLQSGMGSVAKASLYKPLAEKDHAKINTLVATIEAFFKKIAFATILYVAVLCIFYPTIIAKEWDFAYVASLVIIIGIGTVAQYYFGITYQMLVEADQNSYIYSILQIISMVLNTIFVVVLIEVGSSIQVVKLASATIFLLRPFCLNLYVRKKYKIDRRVPQDKSLLKQRWDGFWQAIAYFIHSKTDVFVLTVFATFTQVSIYGVYTMITTAMAEMIKLVDKAIGAALGNIYALNETEKLNKTFRSYCTLTHMLSTVLFSTAAVTACSFINIYTAGFNDANYIQPLFCYIIMAAEMIYCLRLPYNSLIYVAGKFKETRNSALIEAGINIVLSCILVPRLGLVGVAIGTLTAMVYRTVYFVCFLKDNVIGLSVVAQIKRFAISLLLYFSIIYAFNFVSVKFESYLSWILYAGTACAVISLLTFSINYLFYKEDIRDILSKVRRVNRKKI